ncbi:MAG: ATP-binding protein [Gammaproteobacteria bacterium]
MSLRRQLLLVSLLTLFLPWAGCEYITELESALREGQQNSLQDSANAIASILQERQQLLYRYRSTFSASSDPVSDVYAYPVTTPLTIDGYDDDWTLDNEQYRKLRGGETTDGTLSITFAMASNRQNLYLFLSVTDDYVVYRNEANGPVHDSVRLVFWDSVEKFNDLIIETNAPGEVRAHWLNNEPAGDIDPSQIFGNWQPTSAGYNVEIQIPQSLVGPRFGFAVIDGDSTPLDPLPFLGTVDPYDLNPLPALISQPLPELTANVTDLSQGDRRLRVLDRHGWILAEGGKLADTRDDQTPAPSILDRVYRKLLDPGLQPYANQSSIPGQILGPDVQEALQGREAGVWYQPPYDSDAVISSAVPLYDDEQIVGAVTLEQTSAATLLLTNKALKRILTVTFISTAFVVSGLLGFATLLSLRIRRLRNATEHAMADDGRLSTHLPGIGADDELGDLSRSFQTLLVQLKDYTQYLKSLASKLSHELRTPLAVVQSSLDNLQSQELSQQSDVYAQRAAAGVARLRHIVSAMSAASRVEQSIETAEFDFFNLAGFVKDMAHGYGDTYKSHVIEVTVPDDPCRYFGVADLLAQTMDKLVENAVDFTPPGGSITFDLDRSPRHYTLRVTNEGPLLPAHMQERLFDSLISVRDGGSDNAHLGFGLFIARLVTTLHRGEISARNLPNGEGVEFRIVLPVRDDK